jgi:ATP-dependent exoDNAse (exonuclease V) beta subunit
MLLSQINPHSRDENIGFKEDNHEYSIIGMEYKPTSVTTLIHKYFPEFNADAVINNMMTSRNWCKSKYFGRTPESIKEEWKTSGEEAARLGTVMHKNIEDYLNQESTTDIADMLVNQIISQEEYDSKEFKMFLHFWTDFKRQYPILKPYRTEWLVYDSDVGIAGSIDCVLSDNQDNLVIIDWKRSKEIKMTNRYEKGIYPFNNYDNCNYSHYSLQLNFYRHMLETKYGKNVIFMMLVILHPNQPSYICHPINRIDISSIWPTLNK